MPELPEVQALSDFLDTRLDGLAITGVELGSVAVLKTYDPAPDALVGLMVAGVGRHGKFVDIDCDGLHLIFHLARAGWLRWSETAPKARLRPGRSPIALRVRFSDDSGFDLTEAGTKKGLAVYLVESPAAVPGIATLGPDPLSPDFTVQALAGILADRKKQLKGLLREQSVIAGVGNAYSDEILHAARMSPYALASSLDDADIDRLFQAMTDTLAEAVARLHEAMLRTLHRAVAAASGKPAAELKDAKRAGMAVHGRAGQPCPVCGDTVREVSFADSSLQYCPTCQTGGKPLADRRMSRLLK